MARVCGTRHSTVMVVSLALILGGIADRGARAQSSPPRPRIGLALGGGAARGLAHIGVLRWLDEHRVPVDVVGGTSMGGVIGAGLATGMTPDEVSALVASLNWAEILAPDTPFRDKTFRRKEDAREFPSILEFGLRGGIRLPTGFSPAHQITLLFDRIALPYYNVQQFRDLPIPFACVAVDLRKSETVVLNSGRLQDALRATMAIPGVFTPVRMGDRVLVDGGILNNVPADVVKQMGADIVIAVDVGTDLSTEKTSDSLFKVLGETLGVMMRAAVRGALSSANVVLAPNLIGLAVADFSRASEFAQQGYAAAEAQRDTLLRYAIGEEEYRAHQAERKARRRTRVPVPALLTVEGAVGGQAAVVSRRLRRHLSRPLDTALLERDLTLLTGSGRYDTLTYRLEDGHGQTGLIVTALAKSPAPPYLLAALDLQNAGSASVGAAIRGRLTFFDVLTPGSETRLDIGVGQTTKAAAEWYLAVGSGGFFVAPRASYSREDTNVFLKDVHVAEYRTTRRDVGADVGYSTGRRIEMRAGYDRERVEAAVRIGDPILAPVSGSQRFWRFRTVFDGQTSEILPEHGLYATAELRRFTQTAQATGTSRTDVFSDPDNLLSGEATATYFNPLGPRGRLFLYGSSGSSFGDSVSVNAFSLGGPLALGAFQKDELRGSNYLLGGAGYFYEVARLFEGALGRAYLGGWVENGAVYERFDGAQFMTNVSGGLIMETPLGPVSLIGSAGFDGRYRVYVGLGPVFRR
jgi:NTE family protein